MVSNANLPLLFASKGNCVDSLMPFSQNNGVQVGAITPTFEMLEQQDKTTPNNNEPSPTEPQVPDNEFNLQGDSSIAEHDLQTPIGND